MDGVPLKTSNATTTVSPRPVHEKQADHWWFEYIADIGGTESVGG